MDVEEGALAMEGRSTGKPWPKRENRHKGRQRKLRQPPCCGAWSPQKTRHGSKAAVVVEDEVELDQEGKEDSYRDVVVAVLRL